MRSGNRCKTVTVAYDLFSSNLIYIRPSNSYADYIEASLTQRSRAFRDLTIWEVWERNNVRASTAATSKLKKRAGSVNLVHDLEQIAKRSKAAQPKQQTMTKAEKVKGISDNKRQERQYQRTKKAAQERGQKETDSANVIPLHQPQQERKSFKLPSRLKDVLKEEHNDDEN